MTFIRRSNFETFSLPIITQKKKERQQKKTFFFVHYKTLKSN